MRGGVSAYHQDPDDHNGGPERGLIHHSNGARPVHLIITAFPQECGCVVVAAYRVTATDETREGTLGGVQYDATAPV